MTRKISNLSGGLSPKTKNHSRIYLILSKKKEQENSGQLIDREQLQQAGMEVGQSWTQTAGENMMALGKEEFQYGVHKIEDRIDKEGERVIVNNFS